MSEKWETCHSWQAGSGQWHGIELSASASSQNSSHSSVNTSDSACLIFTSAREIFFWRSMITSVLQAGSCLSDEMRTLFFWATAAVFCLVELEFLSTDRRVCVFFPWELLSVWSMSGLIHLFFPSSCRIHWLLDLSLSTCHPEENWTWEDSINKQWPHPTKKKQPLSRTKQILQNTSALLSAQEKRFGITRWPWLLLY